MLQVMRIWLQKQNDGDIQTCIRSKYCNPPSLQNEQITIPTKTEMYTMHNTKCNVCHLSLYREAQRIKSTKYQENLKNIVAEGFKDQE